MVNASLFLLGLPLLVAAAPTNITTLSNSKSSLILAYQNNLNASDDKNHVSFILLDEMTYDNAVAGCAALGESLVTQAEINAHQADFVESLNYFAYSGDIDYHQTLWIQNETAQASPSQIAFNANSFNGRSKNSELPALCTQSSTNNSASATATQSNKISISAGGNTYTGFRNLKSWRFQGIPYANPPQRFVYSTLNTKTGQTIDATAYGAECAQPYVNNVGREDCLFLNVQTPYIPKAGKTDRLRPVMFWIHGGGFTGGTGADPGSDGGNLASKEDIVVVTINYRLSTLGFLAIPGTDIKGNFGIADQIVALEWTIKNIAAFGGDPTKITIIGESAGAGSVRTLLGSPQAIGKFQGGVAMSNLGGGVDLGLSGDYGTTYSSYLTIQQSYAQAGQQIFKSVGCNQTSLDAQIACLKTVDANTLVSINTVARYVVQDGTYVNTENLDVVNKNGSTAYVPVIFGNTHDDGASFSTYPKTPVANESAGIQAALGISAKYAQMIIDSGLFPLYNTGNITLDSFNVSARVATDKTFRCVDQATVYAGAKSGAFKKAYYYQMDRTGAGYDPNNLGGPPVTPGYPHGNPNLPYFRLHGSDMPWVFGNLGTLRDANDLYSIQVGSSYFGNFVKFYDPNPDTDYLQLRGYTKVLEAVQKTGDWDPVQGQQGPIRLIDYPPAASGFIDVPQCAFLNYSLSYYLEGGR